MMPGRNQKLLQQLALAKEAGSRAMAKDFFAPTPGSGGPDEEAQEASGAMPPDAQPDAADAAAGGGDAGGELSPEQLQQLLQMLGGDDQQGA